ncbi:hypothetical protein SGPA1_50534 [Streptomyces misionensis JCM 4497]
MSPVWPVWQQAGLAVPGVIAEDASGDRGPRAGIGRGGPLPGVTTGDSDVPTGSPPRGR